MRNRYQLSGDKSLEKYEWQDRMVLVERTPRRKTLSMRVEDEGVLKVKANMGLGLPYIVQFLEERKDWIEAREEERRISNEKFPTKKFVEGEVFPFLGHSLCLKFASTKNKKFYFTKTDEDLVLHLPPGTEPAPLEIREKLQKFYRSEAESVLPDRVRNLSRLMNLTPAKVSLRNPVGRWGSCNSRGDLNLSWRLVAAPVFVLDSVIIHELAHLKHMNHSKDFWDLVKQFDLYMDEADEWLKGDHRSLDFLKAK